MRVYHRQILLVLTVGLLACGKKDETAERPAGFKKGTKLPVAVLHARGDGKSGSKVGDTGPAETPAPQAAAPAPVAAEPAPAVIPPPAPRPRASMRDSAFELHRLEKFAEAIPLYDAAIFQAPNDAELHYWRGTAHWNVNRNTQAVKDFRRAIDLDSLHYNAHVNISFLLNEERRFDEAIHFWTRYIQRVPNSGEAYQQRAELNKNKGNMGAARADAAKGCQLGNKDACAQVTAFKGMP